MRESRVKGRGLEPSSISARKVLETVLFKRKAMETEVEPPRPSTCNRTILNTQNYLKFEEIGMEFQRENLEIKEASPDTESAR